MKKLLILLIALVTLGAIWQQGGSTGAMGYGTPFNSYLAPVATGPVTLTTKTGVFRAYCNNTSSSAATVTITDNQGSPVALVSAFSVPGNSDVTFPPSGFYVKLQGVAIGSSTNNALNCLVEGFTP